MEILIKFYSIDKTLTFNSLILQLVGSKRELLRLHKADRNKILLTRLIIGFKDLRMEQLVNKIVESKTLIAFVILFSPLIIAMLIITNGQNVGIPKELELSLAGLFYPYLQLVLWIYWMRYSANRLGKENEIDMTSIEKYTKLIGYSRLIFMILILGMLINSIIPKMIGYPSTIAVIIHYVSHGLIIVQLYLFYAWIYGFWILTKTLNDIYEKKGKERSVTIILFFLIPITFGVIHRKIKNELIKLPALDSR